MPSSQRRASTLRAFGASVLNAEEKTANVAVCVDELELSVKGAKVVLDTVKFDGIVSLDEADGSGSALEEATALGANPACMFPASKTTNWDLRNTSPRIENPMLESP
jgi:hypothetical protein